MKRDRSRAARQRFFLITALGTLGLAMIWGCGDGFSTAPVKGTVTFNGEPVKGGSLTFSPTAASSDGSNVPASGVVADDGTYTLATFDSTGAVPGEYDVYYSAPPPEVPEAAAGGHAQTPPSPYAGLVPKEPKVQVTSGSNEINIELVQPGGQ